MPKYRVKVDAPTILYGREKTRETYNPGDIIELSEEEAKKIGYNLETVGGEVLKEGTLPEPPMDEHPDFIEKEDKKGKKKAK